MVELTDGPSDDKSWEPSESKPIVSKKPKPTEQNICPWCSGYGYINIIDEPKREPKPHARNKRPTV